MPLIYKMLFPSISTFETPPQGRTARALAASMAVRVLRTALPPPFIPPAPVIRAPAPSSPPCLPSPLPALLGRCTAINNEFTTGDKRRFFGGKIQHAIGDICGRAGSAKGDPP